MRDREELVESAPVRRGIVMSGGVATPRREQLDRAPPERLAVDAARFDREERDERRIVANVCTERLAVVSETGCTDATEKRRARLQRFGARSVPAVPVASTERWFTSCRPAAARACPVGNVPGSEGGAGSRPGAHPHHHNHHNVTVSWCSPQTPRSTSAISPTVAAAFTASRMSGSEVVRAPRRRLDSCERLGVLARASRLRAQGAERARPARARASDRSS